MCGISGFYASRPKYSGDKLKEMTNTLSHRGPDAEGFFYDGLCGLGHRRLSILDLSEAANQPMYSHDGRYVIVFNGEIYNYRELAKQIDSNLRTSSDTEIILELFARQYTRFVYQLNGMFAIAIYDQSNKELFLFRDRLGIKPLYYYWDDSGSNIFAFASELKAFADMPHLSLEIDLEAVADFLHLGYIPAPKSIYQNIHKLPAGSWLKVSKEGIEITKYWDIQEKIYDLATQERLSLLNREAEAKKQLKKLLSSSVNYRLISDVPLGVFLSGGIDSSTVAALAAEHSDTPINTFSIGFKEDEFNEAPHAQAIAKELGSNHEELILSLDDAKSLIPQLIDFYDEPFADSSAIPTFLVSQMARKQVKVALGGDGGDELFFGYGMYQWAERLSKGFWQSFRKPISKSLGLLKSTRYQKASQLFDFRSKQELASHIFSQEQFLFSRREIDNLMIVSTPKRRYAQVTHKRNLNAMERQALFDLEFYLPDDLLVKVDRASMRHSLEARVPFLDHRVVEFAINLSPALKYKNGTRKYLLKQILYDYLPEKMFNRPKQGFSVPLIDWLAKDLKFLIEENLNKAVVEKYGIVRYAQVEVMKNKFLNGHSYLYNRLWTLIVLHQFLQKQGL